VDLAFYIRNLLYNHEVVIIPGLGALLTKYKPAEINQSDYSVTPPSKFIVFNCNLTLSDGILANHIAMETGTNIPEAGLYIAKEVSIWNNKLNSGETILLEGIGYLSKVEGIIRFEREQEANFYTDTFGLSKVGFKNVELKLTTKHENIETTPKQKKNYSLVYALLILIALGGSGTIIYLYYPGLIQKTLAILHHRISHDQVVPKDTIVKNQEDSTRVNNLEKFFDSATDKKKALAIKQIKTDSSKNVSQGTYYIIAGSFNNFARASKFSNELAKQGHKSEVIQFNQDTFRVSLGEFDDKIQALSELKKIRNTKGAESAWLLSKLD
jgi:hypothetical protein